MNRALPPGEIAEIEALIRAGHPDLQGLCQALGDWSAELKLIESAKLPHTIAK
jgi:hypothetical protein